MRSYIRLVGSFIVLIAATSAHAELGAAPVNLPANAAPSQPVAEIAGNPVLLGELNESAHDALAHQDAVYNLRRRQLDEDYRRAQHQTLDQELTKLVNKRVLQLEANTRKTTPLKVLADVRTPVVSDTEVRALYETRRIEGSPPFEQIAAQLRDGLAQQKTEAALEDFYAALRTKYKASTQLEPLRTQVETVGPSRGAAAGATVTIVEFADFQCPFCRRLEPSLQDLLRRHPDQLRIVYRHYPLTEIHPEALHAAQAAVCADQQGKFWQMHDAIFADSAPLSIDSLMTLARQVGLDWDKFNVCVRSPDINAIIAADVRAGDELSVHSTPTMFVNGRFVEGGVPEEKLSALIDEELELAPARMSARKP